MNKKQQSGSPSAGLPVQTLDTNMRAAFSKMRLPLWVSPEEARGHLRSQNWSEAIALELCEWFARIWSRSFVAGYKGVKEPTVDRASVRSTLEKMGYAMVRAEELTMMLVDGVPGLYAKGVSRRDSIVLV